MSQEKIYNSTSTVNTTLSEYCFLQPNISWNISWNISIPSTRNSVTVWIYLSGVLCVVGAVLNAFLLYITTKYPVLRKSACGLIIWLLALQLFMCSVPMPMGIYRVAETLSNSRPVNCRACRTEAPFHVIANTMVNWVEALLGLNRIIAVGFPTYFSRFNRAPLQYALLTFCVVSTLMSGLPNTFEILSVYRMNPLGLCFILTRHRAALVLLSFNIAFPLFFTTLATVFISTAFVLRGLTRSVDFPDSVDGSSVGPAMIQRQGYVNPVVAARRLRTSKTLLASLFLSVTCQLPAYALALSGFNSICPKTALYFRSLSLIQFSSIPIIFLVMNRDYRRKAMAFIRLHLIKKSTIKPQTDNSAHNRHSSPGASLRPSDVLSS